MDGWSLKLPRVLSSNSAEVVGRKAENYLIFLNKLEFLLRSARARR
jgi:hypothetical protein